MKPPNPSIDELMASVHQGDPTAFELLVQEIRDGMIVFAERLLADQAVAEDCVQESLIIVWSKRETYRPEYPAWPWIAKILRNACYAYWRKDRRSREGDLTIDLEAISDLRTDIEDTKLNQLQLLEAKQAIHRLKPIHREILHLSFFRFMADREIADMLGISLGTVKSRKSRGTAALRAVMNDRRNTL